MKVKVTEYNIHNGNIRLQISTSINVIVMHLAPALNNSKVLTIQILDLENAGHDTTFAVEPFSGKYQPFKFVYLEN